MESKFAFVSDKSFNIPKVLITYFDIVDEKSKTMIVEASHVEVKEAFIKEELLDKDEETLGFSYDFIYYMLTFLAGFLVSKIKIKKRDTLQGKDEIFAKKIESSKSLDELVMVLAINNRAKYEELILKIETKKITSLSSAKKEVKIF